MPGDSPSVATASADPAMPKPPPNNDDHALSPAVSKAMERMLRFITHDPYFNTIRDQTVEPRYHFPNRQQAHQWTVDTPFDPTEHPNTQYQTFIYWGQDHPTIQQEVNRYPDEQTQARSKINTPNSGPKKVINFNTYKRQKSGATPQAGATPIDEAEKTLVKQPAVKGPVERVKAETAELLAAIEAAEKEDVVSTTSLQQAKAVSVVEAEKGDLKRKREDSFNKKIGHIGADSEGVPSSTKKARTSTPSTKHTSTGASQDKISNPRSPATTKSPDKQSTVRSKLPPARVSPLSERPSLLPPDRVSPERPSLLPPQRLSPELDAGDDLPLLPTARLSPTLPDNIDQGLRLRAEAQTSDSSGPNSISKKHGKLNSSSTTNNAKRQSPAPRNGFRANSDSPVVHADIKEEEATSPPQMAHEPQSVAHIDKSVHEEDMLDKPPSLDSLIVKLKFKKHQRPGLQALLKLPARVEKSATPKPPTVKSEAPSARVDSSDTIHAVSRSTPKAPDHRSTERRTGKGVAQKLGPATTTLQKKTEEPRNSSEKRPRVEDDESTMARPPKKKKIPEAVDVKSKGPSTPLQPASQSPTTIKSVQITPGNRKDYLHSQAMRRDLSSDSHITTPLASTPTANGISAHQTSSSGLAARSSSSQQTISANKTPGQLAWNAEQKRLLDLGRDLKHAASADVKSNKARAAVKALESYLSFIFGFICAEFALPPGSKPGKTELGLWRSLEAFSPFPESICKDFPLPSGLVSLLTMIFRTHVLDIVARDPKIEISHRSLLDSHAAAQHAARKTDELLGFDGLGKRFPEAWAGRCKGKIEATVNDLEPGKLVGDYRLPVLQHTSPLLAARAANAMLVEWVKKEGVEYEMQLKL